MSEKAKGRGNWYLLSKYLNENGISYKQYLQSEHWQDVKQRFYNSGLCKKWGRKKCWRCKNRGRLNVHHKTYIRLGNERLDDFLLLCESCHSELHEKMMKPDGTKANLWQTSRKFIREARRARLKNISERTAT